MPCKNKRSVNAEDCVVIIIIILATDNRRSNKHRGVTLGRATGESWEAGSAGSGRGSYAMIWSLNKTLYVKLKDIQAHRNGIWHNSLSLSLSLFLMCQKERRAEKGSSGTKSCHCSGWRTSCELCVDPLGSFLLFPCTLPTVETPMSLCSCYSKNHVCNSVLRAVWWLLEALSLVLQSDRDIGEFTAPQRALPMMASAGLGKLSLAAFGGTNPKVCCAPELCMASCWDFACTSALAGLLYPCSSSPLASFSWNLSLVTTHTHMLISGLALQDLLEMRRWELGERQ